MIYRITPLPMTLSDIEGHFARLKMHYLV